MKVGLVLGAGGVGGGAWLTGALHALASETGWDPAEADYVVGTSAGSMIGALCASGVPPWFMVAHSRGESFAEVVDVRGEPASNADRAAGAVYRPERAFPSLGPGSWSLALRGISQPKRHPAAAVISAWLPKGMISTDPLKEQIRRVVPEGWSPHPNLWIVTCDFASERYLEHAADDEQDPGEDRERPQPGPVYSRARPVAWKDPTVRTIVLSDLHLAAGFDGDLLRRPRFREILLREVEGADEIVLLGDAIELRDRPLGEVLEIARPFFTELGDAMADRRVVIVPGNHDHQLIGPWLERRRLEGHTTIGLEQRAAPDLGIAARIAALLGSAELELAYPGVWMRPNLYATHGHYLDCHVTVPTFERLAIAAIERLSGALPEGLRSTDDYESIQAPLYGLLYGVAQSGRRPRRALAENASARVWEAVHGRDGRRPDLRGRLLGSVVLPGAVALANRIGLGPLRWDISFPEISRAGYSAMLELVSRLGIEADHVLFGHTHRRGPLDGEPGWALPSGTRLINTGSWVFAPGLAGRSAHGSPFWPGTAIEFEDDEVPQPRHLLDGVGRDELARD